MSDYPWPAYYYPAYDDQQYNYRGGDKDQQQEVGTQRETRQEYTEIVLATALPIIIIFIFIG